MNELTKTTKPPAIETTRPRAAEVITTPKRQRAKSLKTRKVTLSLDTETADRLGVHALRMRVGPGRAANEILLNYLRRSGAGRRLFDLPDDFTEDVARATTPSKTSAA